MHQFTSYRGEGSNIYGLNYRLDLTFEVQHLLDLTFEVQHLLVSLQTLTKVSKKKRKTIRI